MPKMTKDELKEEGFIYISTNATNNIEVWARFTGYEDCIQYIDYIEGTYTGDIQTTTFGRLCLFQNMYMKMLQYPKVNQNGYIEKTSGKWI